MKVIFLDLDGVIIHKQYSNKNLENIDKSKIALLKQIVLETDAKIVFISNWRVYNEENSDKYPYSLFEKLLEKEGLSIYDNAPILKPQILSYKIDQKNSNYIDIKYNPFTTRGGEIYNWLKNHDNIDSFVIIDDENFCYDYFGYQDNHIKTDPEVGLTEEEAEKIISFLNHTKHKTK